MADALSRPILRPVETIVVEDPREGKVLVLRDSQGIAPNPSVISIGLLPIVGAFTGAYTCRQIARAVSRSLGTEVTTALVVQLANELEDALYIDSPKYREARRQSELAFSALPTRPASFAGLSYHADPEKLRMYIEDTCLNDIKPRSRHGKLAGLIVPHIDPWRGARGYGHAYSALRSALTENIDTFVLLGTSHAPMRSPFALCRKPFETPLGVVPADLGAIDSIAAACSFDPYRDEFNHMREHSLEFQAVMLQHILNGRPIRIVPILAGLGEQQIHGKDPGRDASLIRFFDAIKRIVERGNVLLIAAADLSHVGPRFGDETAYDTKQRDHLEKLDRGSLAYALTQDAVTFWRDVVEDRDTRRICGLAPIYSLLRSLPWATDGALFHYEQCIDANEGSIVSHAAAGYFI